MLLHGIFLFFVFLAWQQIKLTNKTSETENTIMQAYTYSPKTNKSNQSKNKLFFKEKLNVTSKKNSLANNERNTEEKKIDETSNNKSTNNKQTTDQLLVLLHSAIQAQQHYPHSALIQKQTGTVTLSFILFPDGRITSIKITQSSGFESLDEAAINAVENAAPIKEVSRYLINAKNFSIDLHFTVDSE